MADETLTITINGKTVTTSKGTTIFNAAKTAGIQIPHFCYHPYLSISGNCRMCLVEVEGWPKLVISCSTTVQDGMVVHTDNEKVREAVKAVLEFILLNHPLDCPICDQSGECKLQDYYMEYGLHDSRMPLKDKVQKRKVIDLGPKIVLDTERCILCSRCIRFCNETSGTDELTFIRRGNKMEITTFQDTPLDNPYSMNTIDICPVGALTSRDFRFKCRVWYLETFGTICDHCSTGCNIWADQNNNRVYRFRPRMNTEVNKTWMCDEGRLSYKKFYARERVEKPMIRKDAKLQPAPWDIVYNHVNNIVESIISDPGPEAIGVIASPKLSTEELFMVKEYFVNMVQTPNMDFRVDDGYKNCNEMEDNFLRRKEKNPNTMGALLLGMVPGKNGADIKGMLEKIGAGNLKMLFLVMDHICEGDDASNVKELLGKVEHLVLVTADRSDLFDSCEVVMPLATSLEKEGTFVNGTGRIQKFSQVVNPPGHAISLVEIMNELMQVRGYKEDLSSVEKTFSKLGTANTVFQGLSFEEIPGTGVQLDIEKE